MKTADVENGVKPSTTYEEHYGRSRATRSKERAYQQPCETDNQTL